MNEISLTTICFEGLVLADMIKQVVCFQLAKNNWSCKQVSKVLDIPERTLYRKIRQYGGMDVLRLMYSDYIAMEKRRREIKLTSSF